MSEFDRKKEIIGHKIQYNRILHKIKAYTGKRYKNKKTRKLLNKLNEQKQHILAIFYTDKIKYTEYEENNGFERVV